MFFVSALNFSFLRAQVGPVGDEGASLRRFASDFG